MLQPSLSSTVKAAHQQIERHTQKQRAPMVVWAGTEETAQAFASRMAGIRKRWNGRILAAVPHDFAVPAGVQAVLFPEKLYTALHPDYVRYRLLSGGRDSGKSHSCARAALLRMLSERIRLLCAREYQNSITESVHRLLVSLIDELKLAPFFDITDRSIICKVTGSEAIFAGLHHNAPQLKSLEAVKICWVEESAMVSKESLQILLPTIRMHESEVWFSYNPDSPDAAIEKFRTDERSDVRKVHVTWLDNPWHSNGFDADREALRRNDPDMYAHIWLGECRTRSEAQVFGGKYRIDEFEASMCDGPYFGCDFGFSKDPTVLVRCWVANRTLYIDYEAYGVGCDIDKTAALFDTIPGARTRVIRADCARPETISYLQRDGYPLVQGCEKWKNCAEDGINFIRGYDEIVIHPRCVRVAEEMRLYSYKVDRLTGDVTRDLVDKNNDGVDALRYALEPLIKKKGAWCFGSI